MPSREPQILTPPPDGEGIIRFDDEESAHLARVLRMKPGDRFIAFDGRGAGWSAEIAAVNRSLVTARTLGEIGDTPPMRRVTVAVGSVKASRMDWAVEKAAECGASAFIPLESRYSVVEPGAGKVRRWRSLALAAAKQSRRLQVMEVSEPSSLDALLTGWRDRRNAGIFLCNVSGESPGLKEFLDLMMKDVAEILILIGPEGGWSEEEIAAAKEAGAATISLGDHTLRTETAVVAAVWGVMNTDASA